MKAITYATLEKMAEEMVRQSSLEASMDYLEEHQPDVLSYLMLTFSDGRTEAGMQACQLGWCVYRAFELESEQPIRRITMFELAKKANANQELLDGTKSHSIDEFMEVMSLEMAAQPAVLHFVRRCLAMGLTDDAEQNRKAIVDIVAIFLAVKSVVEALDSATN